MNESTPTPADPKRLAELKAMHDGHPEQSEPSKAESHLNRLLSQPKLTNREAAEAIAILANRAAALSQNDARLHRILSEFGPRLDRLDRAVFDSRDETGKVSAGLARSLQQTQFSLGTVQRNLSEVHLHNQVMRRLVAWLVGRAHDGLPFCSIEDVNSKYSEMLRELVNEGEKVAAYEVLVEKANKATLGCQSCRSWRSVATPGADVGCTRKLVQVRCQKCGFLFPKPVDPMHIHDSCPKCGTALVRQHGSVTMCASFDRSITTLRQACLDMGVPADVLDLVFKTEDANAEEPSASAAAGPNPA